MKFRSERDSLVEAFSDRGPRRRWSRRVVGRVCPVCCSVCEGNRLIGTGTDLDLTIRVEQEVIGLEDGSCVVPARLAADIVRSLEPGAVTVEARTRKGRDLGGPVALRAPDLPGGGVPGRGPGRAERAATRSGGPWRRACARWSGPPRATTPDRC